MRKNSFGVKSVAIIGGVIALFAILLFFSKEYRQAIRGLSSVSYFNYNPIVLLWFIIMIGVGAMGLLGWQI